MMNKHDILDDDDLKKDSSYGILAWYNFICTLVLGVFFAILTALLISTFRFEMWFNYLQIILLGLIILSSISGFGFSIFSLFKREKLNTKKTISILGNIFFFFVIIGLVAFIMVDIINIWM